MVELKNRKIDLIDIYFKQISIQDRLKSEKITDLFKEIYEESKLIYKEILASEIDSFKVLNLKSRLKKWFEINNDIFPIINRLKFINNQINSIKDSLKNDEIVNCFPNLNYRFERITNIRNRIVSSNLRLVVNISKKYLNNGVAFLDLIQEGNLGLIKSVYKFDYRLGNQFSTYATWWIRQAISRYLQDKIKTVRVPVHVQETSRKLIKKYEDLYEIERRNPSCYELSEYVDLPEYNIVTKLVPMQFEISLNDSIEDSEEFISDSIIKKPFNSFENNLIKNELKQRIIKQIATLSPREEQILRLRLGLFDDCDHTLEEIGSQYGLTRERIRQIEGSCFRKLKHPTRINHLKVFKEFNGINSDYSYAIDQNWRSQKDSFRKIDDVIYNILNGMPLEFDKGEVDKYFQRLKSNVKIAPGVYVSKYQISTLGFDYIYPELLSENQCKLYSLARWAGEPINWFPGWGYRIEHALCCWSVNNIDPKLFESLLAISNPMNWPVSQREKDYWIIKKNKQEYFHLRNQYPENIYQLYFSTYDFFNAVRGITSKTHVSWMSLNQILGNRLDNKKVTSLLAFLVYIDAISPTDGWQEKHLVTPKAKEIFYTINKIKKKLKNLDWSIDFFNRIGFKAKTVNHQYKNVWFKASEVELLIDNLLNSSKTVKNTTSESSGINNNQTDIFGLLLETENDRNNDLQLKETMKALLST